MCRSYGVQTAIVWPTTINSRKRHILGINTTRTVLREEIHSLAMPGYGDCHCRRGSTPSGLRGSAAEADVSTFIKSAKKTQLALTFGMP